MKHCQIMFGIALVLAGNAVGRAALFFDDFSTAGSAANYTKVETGSNAVTYAFDYSSMGIPPAPKTNDASTLGVKFESNIVSPGAVAAVTLHTVQQFSGPYKVMFDAWVNANGPFPAGGTGSTEFLSAGVGGDGVSVNRTGATGSGAWTAVDGEGQSGIDYRLFRNAGVLEGVAGGSYAAGTQASARSAADPYYLPLNPVGIDVSNLPVQGANNGGPAQQNGTTQPGTFGFAWHQVELDVDPTGGTGGTSKFTWTINGLKIGTLDAGAGAAFPTNGSVTIGYFDPFASFSDNVLLSFGLIDNLTVVVPEPSVVALLLTAAIGLTAARRR